MNEISSGTPSTGAGTTMLALSAALAAGQPAWPVHVVDSYSTGWVASSYSPFMGNIRIAMEPSADAFSKEIASIYAALVANQESLGREFEAIWDANVDALYEA